MTAATLGWASKGEVSSQVLWTTGARPEEVSEADAQRVGTGRVGKSQGLERSIWRKKKGGRKV